MGGRWNQFDVPHLATGHWVALLTIAGLLLELGAIVAVARKFLPPLDLGARLRRFWTRIHGPRSEPVQLDLSPATAHSGASMNLQVKTAEERDQALPITPRSSLRAELDGLRA
jgi:hypothetical protein